MRATAIAGLLALIVSTGYAEEPRAFTRAKSNYLQSTWRAEDRLVMQLQAAVSELARQGQFEEAMRLRSETHRILFTEWKPSAVHHGPDHLKAARQQYVDTIRNARDELAMAMVDIVQQLGAAARLAEAQAMKNRVEAIKAGVWEPSLADRSSILLANAVRGEHGWILPLRADGAPKELGAAFARRSVLLSGKAQIDWVRMGGVPHGHLGKAIVFESRRVSGLMKVTVPMREDGTYYSIGAVIGENLTGRADLPVDVGKVYRWEFRTLRRSLRFELSYSGTKVFEWSAPVRRETRPVIFTTVRNPGDRAALAISVD